MSNFKYCPDASCGGKTAYIDGITPKRCCSCGNPFDKAFAKAVFKPTPTLNNDNGNEDWDYELSQPTYRQKIKLNPNLAQITIAKKITIQDLTNSEVSFERGNQPFNNGGGAVESNFNEAEFKRQIVENTRNAAQNK